MSKFAKIFLIASIILGCGVIIFTFRPKQTQAPTNNTPPVDIKTTTIFFGGDIMLSRNVAAKIYAADDILLPFEKIMSVTKAADISFANLESPFNNQGVHSIEGSLVFNADPKFVGGLESAGFDILSTANNHSFDQGQKGLDYTLSLLHSRDIKTTGTVSSADISEAAVIKNRNILFGFLGYSYTALNDGGKSTSPYVKDFNNLTQLKQDIIDLKGHNADVVIASMHAGTEYTRTPTQSQIDFAHAAIDAGADLVIGHHPHWIQTVEQYKGKWIFYSLGNLVFDQMWSQDTREGLTLLVTYKENEIKKIELKPVVIDDFCCPRWANSTESAAILRKLDLTNPILIDKN